MTFGLGSDYADKPVNNTANMPDKVDKVNQGSFDRSMNKNATENTLDQQTMQQIMERLAPLIAQFIQEILGGEQQDAQTPSGVSGGAGEPQGVEATDQSMSAEQGSMSPQEQLIQQILDRLLPYIEQMVQEMNAGNSQGEPSENTNQAAPAATNGMGSEAPQSGEMQNGMNSDSQLQSQQDQLTQQIMQVLVPMIAQIIESVLGQGGLQAQGMEGMATTVQANY